MLLPDMTDASGTVRHLLVGAGKDTNIYVADRDNLGKFNHEDRRQQQLVSGTDRRAGAWRMVIARVLQRHGVLRRPE